MVLHRWARNLGPAFLLALGWVSYKLCQYLHFLWLEVFDVLVNSYFSLRNTCCFVSLTLILRVRLNRVRYFHILCHPWTRSFHSCWGARSRHGWKGLSRKCQHLTPVSKICDGLRKTPAVSRTISLEIYSTLGTLWLIFLYNQYLSDWFTFLCIIAKVISIIYYSYHSLYTDRVLRAVLEEKTDLCNVLNESSRIIWT